MAIIVSKDGQNAERIEQTNFGLEDKLQEYIYNNPDAIPLYDIDEDTRLFIAAREFATKSGPIDALGFDAKGNIYVVETKLYKNPDKRTVVAQALDYGASLWRNSIDFDTFISQIDTHTQKQFGKGFDEKLAEFFNLESTENTLNGIKTNLSDGAIKFVVLMDRLHDALKDLVIFVNQNSKFDLYAVELEYYKHAEYEIIIPKLYGAEVKKEVATAASKSEGAYMTRTNKDEFFSHIQKHVDSGNISSKLAEAVAELANIMLDLTAKTGGTSSFMYTRNPTREDFIKLIVNDSNNTVTINLDTDSSMGFWVGGKTGSQVDFINSALDKLIAENLLGRTEQSKSYSRWWINLRSSSADEIDRVVNVFRSSLGEIV